MITEYIRFFINGGILGVIAWGMQQLIYNMLGVNSADAYTLSSVLTYLPLVLLNYFIQRSWIFNRQGLFVRFLIANLMIMLLVAMLSPVCREMISIIAGSTWGDRMGFIMAALIGSIPSFLIKRQWVFGKRF